MMILDIGDFIGVGAFVLVMLISVIASISKKAREQREARESARNSNYYAPSQRQASRNQPTTNSFTYDPDLAPDVYEDPDDAGIQIEPLTPPALKGKKRGNELAAESKPIPRRGAAAAKARVAAQRQAEGHNLAERPEQIESSSVISVRAMLKGKARDAILVSEILSAPRCRRPLSRK